MTIEQLQKLWDEANDKALEAYELYDKAIVEHGANHARTLKARIIFHQKCGYADALRDLCDLCEKEIGVHRPIVTVSEVQPDKVESVTPYGDYCGYCYHHHADCTCDYCELEGHNWTNLTGYRACLVCGIEEDVTTLSWMEEAVEEALQEDQAADEEALKSDWTIRSPKTKAVQVQDALENAKKSCKALPSNGFIEYVSGQGFFLRYLDDFDRKQTYCWLGWSERALKWLADVQTTGIPNFAALRVGVK